MKFWVRKIALLVLMCICLSACHSEAPRQSEYYAFTDDLGREVVLERAPKKVAVLFSSFAEVWTLAGGRVDITVGESVERGFAAKDAVLVDSGAGKTVNTEKLVAQRPDFVICSADVAAQVKAAEFLHAQGIPAACFRVESFTDYLSMLKKCTDITGDAAAYETNGAAVEKRIKDLLSALDGNPNHKKILFIRSGSGASSAKAKGSEDHFAAAMLREIGTQNIADAAPVLLDGLSEEEILRADPDFIFITTMGNEKAAKAYMEGVLSSSIWQSLTAVKRGKVAFLPRDLFQYKPNARWDKAYGELIQLVYETTDDN